MTRPDLFRNYLTEQIRLLIENHGVPVEIGESKRADPDYFAYRRDINIEAPLGTKRRLGRARDCCATCSIRPILPAHG